MGTQNITMEGIGDNDNLYQKMIEEIQDYAIILMDRDGIIRNWNKGAEKIKYYTEQEILGKHFSIFYLQADLDNGLPQKLMTEAVDTGRANQEGWRKRKDGSIFWGSITITALHDDADHVIGFCKVTRDLTDKKITEDNLRMSEERYHQMIAEVQDYAIILLNAQGIIENWNAGAQAIKGYSRQEIVGKRFDVFYTPEDRASGLPDTLLASARETGKATQEGWRVRKDGTRFWGMIVITALHSKTGAIIGFSKVTRDLTDKKTSDDKLAAYTAELERQNSELEQFAYVASHDLQEPLRKIQTFSGMIRERYDDKDYVNTYLTKLDHSARRMSDLMRSLLNYSRLTRPIDQPVCDAIDLHALIGEICVDLELIVEEKKAAITCSTLPVIAGNPIQLRQLFSNLISNSLKFSQLEPEIRISCEVVNKKDVPDAPASLRDIMYHRISVEDNGIGFEEQYSKKIFSLFQRLHGRDQYPGTGIGLALCKKITENHNGTITAYSEPGKGARFCVYLPYR